MPGYIKLYRDLQYNTLWHEKPYTRGQAWVDMLLRCNHICAQMGPQYQSVWILRGQFLLSNVKLGEAWGWSEKTVRRFMDYLENESMVKIIFHNKFTVYEVIKYAELQALDTELFEAATRRAKAEQKPSKRRARAERMPTNNNDNNDNNDKKLKDIYVSVQHLSMSKEEYEKLILSFGEEKVKAKLEYAENYKNLKNYLSLYKTINNWLKSDKKESSNPFQ
jgi:hypothetical protein